MEETAIINPESQRRVPSADVAINEPYKGPKAYSEQDGHIFFGRKEEAEALITLIEKNRVIILFGRTGTGKTSLVNASLFPGLKQNYYFPVYIRVKYELGDENALAKYPSPVESVRRQLVKHVKAALKSDNPEYEFETDLNGKPESLLHYLQRINFSGGLITPVLFFDQFEELFRFGYKTMRELADELVDELAGLVNYDSNNNAYKIVFSFREDFMAQMEDLRKLMPALMRCRFRLKKFQGKQAMEVIRHPKSNLVSREAAIAIINALGREMDDNYYEKESTGEKWQSKIVDPIILSIYCYELNKLRIKLGRSEIDEGLVRSRSASEVLHEYYMNAVKHSIRLRKAVENELIGADNNAKGPAKPLDALCEKYGVKREDFELLESKHRLVKIENGHNGDTIEITHDMMAEQILSCKNKRLAKERFVLIAVLILAIIAGGVFMGLAYKKYMDNKAAVETRDLQLMAAADEVNNLKKSVALLEANQLYYDSLLSKKSLGNDDVKKILSKKDDEIRMRDIKIAEMDEVNSMLNQRINILIATNQNRGFVNVDSITRKHREIVAEKQDAIEDLTMKLNSLKANNDRLSREISDMKQPALVYRGLDCFIKGRGVTWEGVYIKADEIYGEKGAAIVVEVDGEGGKSISGRTMHAGQSMTFEYQKRSYTFTVISIQDGCQGSGAASVHFSLSATK